MSKLNSGPNLSVDFAGIQSPNPFWLASAPPTNTGEQIMRAFDAGWGGAVWKTIGAQVTNTSSRYGAIGWRGLRMMGFSNIELISDRPLDVNLSEIAEVKKRYPKQALVVSLMVESTREAWHNIVRQAENAGADGLELNFGCPHGMSERGMGSAVGQVPEYIEMITEWVKERATTPVIVKLTPNVADIRVAARAAKQGGTDALSAINTINSIIGIDLDTLLPQPNVDGRSSHGGYSGPAVKPIALNMVEQVMSDLESRLPLSGIGGIAIWSDAAEFILLGAGTVQICTAVMHHGYRIVEDMIEGLENWMRDKGFRSIAEFRGLSLRRMTEWKDLNLNYKVVAQIDAEKCIGCGLCYTACWDGAHQCIHMDRERNIAGLHLKPEEIVAASKSRIVTTPIPKHDGRQKSYVTPLARIPRVDETECVGCNLCSLVCPVDDCITMIEVDAALTAEDCESVMEKSC